MKLPSKKEMKNGVQFFLLINATVWGFVWQYIYLWVKIGLPQEWWSLLACFVFGLLSAAELIHWIVRS